MTMPPQPDAGCALFLDFDGTLTEIAPTPGGVRVAPDLAPTLAALARAVDGALAIVTGRALDDLDRHLHPLRLPASGVHGIERRGTDGVTHRVDVGDLGAAHAHLQAFAQVDPRLLVEAKPGALALHFRLAPEREAACLLAMRTALALTTGMTLQPGKMLFELKPAHVGKGDAVRAFLREPPFRGRRPWFVGDDVTDEAAFEAVHALHGVAVKVGPGATAARYRLPDPAAVRHWLRRASHVRA
jgi:trehalose 6-phosphate phosphatase